MNGILAVGSSALLGGGFDKLNNVCHCLGYFFMVVNIAFGNYCNQLVKLDLAGSSEITRNQRDIPMPRNQAINENRGCRAFGAAAISRPLKITAPSFHKNQEISLTCCSAGCLISADGEIVSGNRGNQASNNTSGDESGNVNVWVCLAQYMVKIIVCGAIGGLIAASIYLWRVQPPNDQKLSHRRELPQAWKLA